MSPKLSIVLGTCDRLPLLMRCLDSIYLALVTENLSSEIVIVDGGSTDGTREYLLGLGGMGVRVIWQGQLLGAVKAFNAGFREARGQYVAALNDDATVHPTTFGKACYMLDNSPVIGQVAIPFGLPDAPPALDYIRLGHYPKVPYLYANFGVTRRDLGERFGWWGEAYYHYGGDSELSMQVWKSGYRVAPLAVSDGHITHYREQDEIRREHTGADRDAFYNKWEVWHQEK